MLIEELILFDKSYLSEIKLIFGHYNRKWIAVLIFLFFGIGISFFLALYTNSYILKILYFALMLLCLRWSFRYSKGKTLSILKRHVREGRLNEPDIWKNRYVVIKRIQLRKLKIYLSSNNCNKTDTIHYIIESLKDEQQYPKYKYQFLQIFLTLFSVLVAAFFAAIVTVPKMFSSWESVILFFKPIAGFSLLVTVTFWFCEFMLIRGIFETRGRKHKRLIRLLENMYIRTIITSKNEPTIRNMDGKSKNKPGGK